jgi:hypothetical protein
MNLYDYFFKMSDKQLLEYLSEIEEYRQNGKLLVTSLIISLKITIEKYDSFIDYSIDEIIYRVNGEAARRWRKDKIGWDLK